MKEDFDWEEDRRPKIPADECIVYKIHPRGFSKHASFKGESWRRGTFGAVADKIPYMKELGITTVEMMPPVEFDEVMEDVPGKVNYWGTAVDTALRQKQPMQAQRRDRKGSGKRV